MTFAHPHMLWFLLVFPPALLAFFWWSARTREKLMTRFIQARLLPGLVKGVSTRRQKIRATSLIVAVAALIVALARPQWGYELEEVSQHGLDIVVAIDTSKSMLATDIVPNRLARAKLAALDLMHQAKSDRLGLVAFAGGAFLQCPLTVDDSAFRQSVELLDVNVIPQGGTALAEAIDNALTAFKEGGSHRVLVLFTDGEDHDSDAIAAAKRAAERGLRIFTIGIGSAEGELLPQDQVRDEQGNVVKSRLNDGLLRQIAGAANGFYLPLRGANTIDTLYQQGLAPLPKSEGREKWMKRPHERYHWPLALAIGLLLFEMLFPERRSSARRASRTQPQPAASEAGAPALTVVLLLLALPGIASGSPSSALREYRSGKYEEALKEYEQLLQRRKDDPRLHFNAGAAAYRDRQYDDAMKHFDEALRSPDLKLQEQAYYNRGNTFYQLGESAPDQSQKSAQWEKSLKDYESTLKLNPQDADARFNRDFVKQKLEELKQQQQQQQSQQNQQQQNQDQQKQDPQQAKNDQQQQSDSQKQDEKNSQSAQEQKRPEQNQQEQQQQADRSDEQKKQDQQQARQSPGQEPKDQEQSGQEEAAQAYADGQMTPQQAQQLLDAQKGEEKVLPMKPEQKKTVRPRPVKDW